MKIMKCNELGGACDKTFKADTFEQIAEMAKKHGMEMYQKGDVIHIEAMTKMSDMMSDPDSMQQWLDDRKKEFDALP